MTKKQSTGKKMIESKYAPDTLRQMIQEGKNAGDIKKALKIVSMQSLRQHVLRLINEDRQFYEVPGLYVRNIKRPMINFKGEIRLTKKMIDFSGTTYKHGDVFEIDADNDRIILTRIVDTPAEQKTTSEDQETITHAE